MRPPQLDVELNSLSPSDLHEKLVEVLGLYLMSGKTQSIKHISDLINSKEAQEKLATAFRPPYEKAAALFNQEELEIIENIESLAVDLYLNYIFGLLAGTGISLSLNSTQAARFRLTMEICDKSNERVIHEEVLNRGGKKFFPDYLKLWLTQSHKNK